MEALKKQASKLRERVAKQQQAVRKQFSGRYNQDPSLVDEAELECHQNLQRLYNSTRAAKHFQRNIIRGVEGFIAVSTKQMEIVKRLAEDCCRYGDDNQKFGFALAKASVEFGKSHNQIEKERENLLKVLGEQVFEPLREMIMSAPLEDARLLTYRYQRIRQDMESQIADVMRKQLKSKEGRGNADSSVKLQHAESKLSELRTTLAALGREATAAMEAVEAHQQQVTYERLLAMVDAERAYHQNAADILNKLHDEMLHAKNQESENHYDEQSSGPESEATPTHVRSQSSTSEDPVLSKPSESAANGQEVHFVGEVIHPFDAQADGELSIAVGDYVVVRQVATNGWSEGECKGKAGWFPSAYVQQRDKAPASKLQPTLPSLSSVKIDMAKEQLKHPVHQTGQKKLGGWILGSNFIRSPNLNRNRSSCFPPIIHQPQAAALLDSAGAEFIVPRLTSFCCRSIWGSDEVATVVLPRQAHGPGKIKSSRPHHS